MKKLKINKACPCPDLASISAFPPMVDNSRNVNTFRTRLDGRSAPPAQVFNNRHIPSLRNSHLQPSSQSQQSFSQGLMTQFSQNTTFSQNSQEENIVNDQWRHGSQERDNPIRRNSCFAPYSYGSSRDDSSQVLSLTRPSSANNIHQRINHGCHPDDKYRISEEVEQRFCSVDTALNRVVLVLDSVQSDLQQINKALKDVSIETKGILQKIAVQENTLQLLVKYCRPENKYPCSTFSWFGKKSLKEEEGRKESLLGALNAIPNRITEETSKLKLDEISDALRTIPKMLTLHLSAMKSEICLTFTRQLQDISESLKAHEHEHEPVKQSADQPCSNTLINSALPARSQTKHLREENHKPSTCKAHSSGTPKKPRMHSERISQVPQKKLETKSSLHSFNNSSAMDFYQPFKHTNARRMKEDIYDDEQKTKMSEIIIDIEEDTEAELLYFFTKEDHWGRAGKDYCTEDLCLGPQEQQSHQEEDKEAKRILRRARRKRRIKTSYEFK